jgi:hypothetical protein
MSPNTIFTVAISAGPELRAMRQRKPVVRITPANSMPTIKRGSGEDLGSLMVVFSISRR